MAQSKKVMLIEANSPVTNTDVLTTKEAAALLRMTTRTLYKLAKAGVIPSARVGTTWRFSRAALENSVRAIGSLTKNP